MMSQGHFFAYLGKTFGKRDGLLASFKITARPLKRSSRFSITIDAQINDSSEGVFIFSV